MRSSGCTPSRSGLSRRAFLRTLGSLTVASALGRIELDAYGSAAAGRALAAGALTETLPHGTPICVLVTLDGGNDSLNTLVPVDDPWYYDTQYGHGALALAPETTLGLAGAGYRLHPHLGWLAARWHVAGDVAFVQGVGERDRRNFSHFHAMRYWQTADTSLLEPRGWLGRYNDLVRPASPMASVSLAGLRLESVGETGPVLVVRDTADFQYRLPWYDTADFRAALDLMATTAGGAGYRGQAAGLLATTFAVGDRVRGASDPVLTAGEHSRIAKQLLQAALLIPCQTYTAAFGPFDSHSGQLAMQGDRLTELDEALATFFAAIDSSDRRGDVFVVIVSEFGRKVTANANAGTDHGQSGLAILVGGGVGRGVYGAAPPLDPGGPTRPNRVHDAMRPIVDYRSLHATVLGRLARDGGGVAQAVLRGIFEDLGVFAPADRPRITAPGSGTELARGTAVSFAWTPVPDAAQYGVEFTGPDRQFANPNGIAPDGVNGYGGTGGGFLVPGPGFATDLPGAMTPGTYQVRVIGISAAGQLVGSFSDAVTLPVR
jgi:uncharacterized protein (DUF1501 family)